MFQVDLVEQDKHFLQKATEYLSGNTKIGSLYCVGLQNFDFSSAPQYSVIWCQWVLGHLTKVGFGKCFLQRLILLFYFPQDHLVQFFVRAQGGLAPGEELS